MYIKKTNNRLNKKLCSKELNIPRSTIYDTLRRLESKGLIDITCANAKLTDKGINYLETTNRGVGASRLECRTDREKISLHKSDFIMNIKNLEWGAIEKLDTLNPLIHKQPKWRNNPQHHLHFDGITISIFSKKVIFRVHDILSDNTGQNEYEAFLKVSDYVDKLANLGIHGESIICEPAHFSHIDSYLAGFLKKIDGKYKLELSDGSNIWIDYSEPNGLEDETDKKENRLRVDSFMDDMIIKSESNMSDVDNLLKDMDGMKQVASSLLKIELLKRQPLNYTQPSNERPNYFG